LTTFQEITQAKESAQIEGIMRRKIQGQKASYFFLGSRRGIPLAMFSDRKLRFLQSAVNLELPPLPHEDIIPFLAGLFSQEGKDCPERACANISSKGHLCCLLVTDHGH
jgi:hypothetical protein